MNWEAVGAIGEIVGALAVIATLAYLAIQLRHNTRGLRTSARTTISMDVASIMPNIYQSEETSMIWFKAQSDPDSLSEFEKFRFSFMVNHLLRGQESMYLNYLDGVVTEEHWQTTVSALTRMGKSGAIVDIWQNHSEAYTKSFQQLVQELFDGV